MTTEHPFTTNFGPHDVRVTTHYYEENFISNIFTTLHEGGHALFMQNEPEEFYREYAADSMTNGMHECISRFYENLIGRSEAFIHFIYPKLQELSGGTFADVTERELYEAVNLASPGLIRCDADELTYCLHILVRYELEKAFMNGEITVDEIPALWNEKYKAYLGLDVPDDAQGCLQDVHWTMPIGYFPSYALGSAYGVQILRTMEKELRRLRLRGKGRSAPHPRLADTARIFHRLRHDSRRMDPRHHRRAAEPGVFPRLSRRKILRDLSAAEKAVTKKEARMGFFFIGSDSYPEYPAV